MRNKTNREKKPEQRRKSYKNSTDLARWGTQRGTQGTHGELRGLSDGLRGTQGAPLLGSVASMIWSEQPMANYQHHH